MKKFLSFCFLLAIGVVSFSSCEPQAESLTDKKTSLDDVRSIHLKIQKSAATLFSTSYGQWSVKV